MRQGNEQESYWLVPAENLLVKKHFKTAFTYLIIDFFKHCFVHARLIKDKDNKQ